MRTVTAAPSEGGTVISAATVVSGGTILRPGWLEIRGGIVAAVGSGAPAASPDLAWDEATIVPGFVDMHTHGAGGAAFTDATPQAVATVCETHRRHGTTWIMASLVSAHPEDLLRQVRALSRHVRRGELLGIHLEGPWLSRNHVGAHDPATLRDPDPAEIDRLLTVADGTIRMVTLAPELPGRSTPYGGSPPPGSSSRSATPTPRTTRPGPRSTPGPRSRRISATRCAPCTTASPDRWSPCSRTPA